MFVEKINANDKIMGDVAAYYDTVVKFRRSYRDANRSDPRATSLWPVADMMFCCTGSSLRVRVVRGALGSLPLLQTCVN